MTSEKDNSAVSAVVTTVNNCDQDNSKSEIETEMLESVEIEPSVKHVEPSSSSIQIPPEEQVVVAGSSKQIRNIVQNPKSSSETDGNAPGTSSQLMEAGNSTEISSEEQPKNPTVIKSTESPIQTKKYLPMEVYATVVAAFSFLCIGLLRAYTSPAISSMKDDHDFFNSGNPMSKTVISWVAASPPLGSFFGTILSGLALQYLGRQKTLVILTFPYIAGWLLIGFAKNVSMIMIGRALTGLAAGFSTAAAQLYVSECVRAKVRGFLGFVPAMMLSLGILLGFAISTINLEWKDLALLMTTFPILLLLFAIAVPESPSWLLYRGREKEAIESLKKLRGLDDWHNNNPSHPNGQDVKLNTQKQNHLNEEIEKELEEMKRVMRKRHSTTATTTTITAADNGENGLANSNFNSGHSHEDEDEGSEPQDFIQFVFQDLLGKREIWFPAFVSVSLMIFQQLSGANAVIYYLSVILNEADPSLANHTFIASFESSSSSSSGGGHSYNNHHRHGLDPNVSSVIFGLVQFFAFFLSLPLIDRLGRRVLLIVSALFMIFPHLVLGIYFYVKLHPNSYIHVYTYSSIIRLTSDWLPLMCLCAFIASYSIGFGPVPFIMMSEVFPSNARSYMCALASLVNHLTLFFIIRVFPTLLDWFGAHVMFWLFSAFCFLALIHVAIFVPETKGKTLAEIELGFIKTDNKNSDNSVNNDTNGKDGSSTNTTKGKKGKKSAKEPKCKCCNK